MVRLDVRAPAFRVMRMAVGALHRLAQGGFEIGQHAWRLCQCGGVLAHRDGIGTRGLDKPGGDCGNAAQQTPAANRGPHHVRLDAGQR